MTVTSAFAGVGAYFVDPQAPERFTDLLDWCALLARTTSAVDVARVRDHVCPRVHAWEDEPREGNAIRRRLGVHAIIEQAESPLALRTALALKVGRPRALIGLEMALAPPGRIPWGWAWHAECYEGPNPNATPGNLAFRALVQGGAAVYVPVVGLGSWSDGANPPLSHYFDELSRIATNVPHVPGWAIYNGDETPDSDLATLRTYREHATSG